ncbi:hypothetical protein DesfrDRAFT_0542 [Solidesulfovibrio fructosivorans JJ]]|uniref:Uncharacterized protein n=1 Tax=Solidesulfovibrio fructosivorans JJ] TaxID=596151 RepID=E1JSE3_SOLFR|nr:hypothetical protein [Solidesulfovibrio fructosivorans]EFL52912.1 hypothetical protein DesfrDRAFT_0542 [Solidesulfovibrio fructosivorans JJ]]
MITKETPVEEFVDKPGVVAYCIKNGVSPYSCSGDFPCDLGTLLKLGKVSDPEAFIKGLNDLLAAN